ncbi:MAG: hypothetical protein Ta2E_07540 [Mycoplasmoidaceae bacterium]|nr:MAG: hypothetical protein Ta2E_07540 [Mycoplasmoidaceae bacterium]
METTNIASKQQVKKNNLAKFKSSVKSRFTKYSFTFWSYAVSYICALLILVFTFQLPHISTNIGYWEEFNGKKIPNINAIFLTIIFVFQFIWCIVYTCMSFTKKFKEKYPKKNINLIMFFSLLAFSALIIILGYTATLKQAPAAGTLVGTPAAGTLVGIYQTWMSTFKTTVDPVSNIATVGWSLSGGGIACVAIFSFLYALIFIFCLIFSTNLLNIVSFKNKKPQDTDKNENTLQATPAPVQQRKTNKVSSPTQVIQRIETTSTKDDTDTNEAAY